VAPCPDTLRATRNGLVRPFPYPRRQSLRTVNRLGPSGSSTIRCTGTRSPLSGRF
jgi:hypothetical protein